MKILLVAAPGWRGFGKRGRCRQNTWGNGKGEIDTHVILPNRAFWIDHLVIGFTGLEPDREVVLVEDLDWLVDPVAHPGAYVHVALGENVSRAAVVQLNVKDLVGAIGCSNFSAAELEEAERIAGDQGLARFATLQNQYSLLERGIEAEVAPACERLGVSILPYFPLASGLLSGKYRRGEPGPAGSRLASGGPAGSDEQFAAVEALEAFAAERGIGVLDVAIAGLAAQPAVGSVIAGATKPEQIAANVAALSWTPSPEDLAELDRIAPA